MSFAINTNNDALNTYRNLTNVQNSLSKSLERLSSGLRINQAGDDAAGLTISTQLGSQISGLQQASRNAQDGLSMVQTADGALSQAQSILGRLRDLAVQAGNDSNNGDARNAIKAESDSLVAELGRMATSANFNGIAVLNQAQGSSYTFQVGADRTGASQIAVDLSGANMTTVATGLASGGVYSATLYSAGSAAPTNYDGAYTFTSTLNGVATSVTTASLSGTGTTYSTLAAKLNGDSSFSSKFAASVDGNGKLAITAKDGGQVSVDSTSATRLAAAGGSGTAGAAAVAGTLQTGLDFTSAAKATASLQLIDTQISAVSSARATIGAAENRFNNVISTISTSVQNLTAAKSRITDVDMAQEMVNYTRANVLSQSGTAMLAQANSLPQLALKLLG